MDREYVRLIVPFMERYRYDREREIVDRAKRERENHAFEEHMMGMQEPKRLAISAPIM